MNNVFYSASTGGFYTAEIHGDNIPAGAVEITQQEHAALLAGQAAGRHISADAKGCPVLIDPPPTDSVVPRIVTMRQARLALLGAGLLQQVDQAISALPEPQQSAARIEWDYSSEVHRDRAFVQQLGQALGLSEEQLDALFIQAAAL